jgi:hypothetical protein
LKTLSPHSSLNLSDQVSHPYKTIGKITVLYILNFTFLDSKLKEEEETKSRIKSRNDCYHPVHNFDIQLDDDDDVSLTDVTASQHKSVTRVAQNKYNTNIRTINKKAGFYSCN